jgi:ATP-binding cassette, subfamily F, member 3
MLDGLTNETVILQDGQAFQFKLSFSAALDQFAALAEERLKQRLQEERELEKLRDTAAVLQVWAGRNGKRFSGRYHSQLKRVERAEQNMTETFSEDNRILALGNQKILSDYALKIENVDIAVPGRSLFHVDEILVKPGEKVFIAGANGVGKTTLLRKIEECFRAEQGMSFSPAVSLGVYQQNLQYFAKDETALEYLGKRVDKPTSQLRGCLVKAGFDAGRHDQQISQMSGGERARIKFLELRLRAPSLLLLDEPTNHLDIQGIAQLEEEIEESQSTFVLVSHDRRFLAAVAKRVFVVSNNRIQEVMHIDEYLAKLG